LYLLSWRIAPCEVLAGFDTRHDTSPSNISHHPNSRIARAELTEHLGYEVHGEPASQQTNRRNGATRKVLKGNDEAVPIDIPRDRDGSFEPELIQKGQTRIDGMDDKIIGLYAAGLSTRDIRAHLEEVYGLRVLFQ
jgi:putative transposase